MKITEIEIGRCGVWRDASFSLQGGGLHVFYGPNETGKSTLMRFIRGVLFGFPARSADTARGGAATPWDGALRVEHQGRAWEIRRNAAHGQGRALRGDVTVAPVDDFSGRVARSADSESGPAIAASLSHPTHATPTAGAPIAAEHTAGAPIAAEQWLSEALGGISEELFENVFAIGLSELQTLATLQGDGVSQHIYGASLGPEGRRLLQACSRFDEEQARFLSGPGDRSLTRLSQRRRSIAQELDALGALRDRYDELRVERRSLEAGIARLQDRSATAQRQLRGFHLIEKAWAPWRQVDQLRGEIKSLPDVRRFPEKGLERLHALDTEMASLIELRNRLRTEVAESKRRAGGFTVDEDVQAHTRRMQTLLDSRTWIQDGYSRLTQAESREKQLRRDLDAALGPLGDDWSIEKLAAFDGSPAAQGRLVAAARNYQKAVGRRNLLRKRLKSWSRSCRVRAAEVGDRLKTLGITQLEPALVERRRRLIDLKELDRLTGEEDRLNDREQELRGQFNRLDKRLAYPDWLPVLLWFFAIGGILAAFLGFRQGLQQNAVAGLMWLLLGTTCGGLAWALKSHYDSAVGGTTGRLRKQLQESEDESRHLEKEIDALYRRAAWLRDVPTLAKGGMASALTGHVQESLPAQSRGQAARNAEDDDDRDETSSIAAFLEQSRHELTELERLAEKQGKIAARRDRLSRLRQRFQTLNRDVASTRQQWGDALRRSGLPETTRVVDAFVLWEKLAEAHHRCREWRAASTQLDQTRTLIQPFEKEVDTLGRELRLSGTAGRPAHEVIAGWENRFATFAATRDERAKLIRDGRRKHREALKLTARLRRLRAQRTTLLRDGGAKSRKTFEARATARHRRAELDELLSLAETELRSVAADEPELAIVDEDFRSYDADTHRQRLAACRSECAAAERELQEARERLGSLKQELRTLEADRRELPLRTSAARLDGELCDGLEQWCSLRLAGDTLDALRSRFERDCQPATLAAASQWLERLTRGRYRTIWTPLGQRELRVEDEQGRTFGVDDLSSGAREQLFLAVRLALVRQFREKGIDLPMVLDDVLVNFDQHRTEAALDTLTEFADEGRQVLLFTCHLHLARLAETRRIEPVRLASHAGEGRVERRAS